MIQLQSKSGFTLLEVLLSIILSSALLSAIILLEAPFLQQYGEAFNFLRLRQKVTHPVEALRVELTGAKAVSVDGSQCYLLCMVDKSNPQKRIYYYASAGSIYRKTESTNSEISCSRGKIFTKELDSARTSFSILTGLVSYTLAANGTGATRYILSTSSTPSLIERGTYFFDGFECNSLSSSGWALGNSETTYWEISRNSAAAGSYWLKSKLIHGQVSALNTTAEFSVNLGSAKNAFLQFQYDSSGSTDWGESLQVYFYDGSQWVQVFKDDVTRSISSLQTVQVDLTGYTYSSNNRIRFTSNLIKSNHNWYIDEIEVFEK